MKKTVTIGLFLFFIASFSTICYSMINVNKPYLTKEEIVKNYVQMETDLGYGDFYDYPPVLRFEKGEPKYLQAWIQYDERGALFPVSKEEIDEIFKDILLDQITKPLGIPVYDNKPHSRPEKRDPTQPVISIIIDFTDGKYLDPSVNAKLASITILSSKTGEINGEDYKYHGRGNAMIMSISNDPKHFKKSFHKLLESYLCANVSAYLHRHKTGQWGC